MKLLFPVLFLLVFTFPLFGQADIFIVRGGENPEIVMPVKYRYLNTDYKPGYLTFDKDKKSPTLKFNYDLLKSLLTCINERNDTILVKGDLAVRYVNMGTERFYHSTAKGYFKILAKDTLGMLTSQVQLINHSPVKVANDGFGSDMNKTSVTVVVPVNNEVVYERSTTYFLITTDGAITKANKSGFLDLFEGREKLIKAYLKEQVINFDREEDLLKLFTKCQSL